MALSTAWLSYILSIEWWRQALAFALVLLAAGVVRLLLRRPVNNLVDRSGHVSWLRSLAEFIRRGVLPLLVWLLGQVVLRIFVAWGWPDPLLRYWLVPAAGLWLLYRLLTVLLAIALSPGPARFWSTRILLPLLVGVGVLNGVGMLTPLLRWGILLGSGQRLTLGSTLAGLAIIVVVIALARALRQFLEEVVLPQAGAEPALAHALGAFVTYALITIGILTGLNTVGLDLTTLTVVLGGLSVGLGFGLQAVVNNLVSGLILTLERSIGPGDVIQVDNTTGVVQHIGVRSMTIKTGDNVELIIPNSRFLSETMTNLTRNDPRVRIRIGVKVPHGTAPREVERALLEASQHPDILPEPAPSVQFRDLLDNGLLFDLLVWTDQATRIPQITSDLRYSIWQTLAAHSIPVSPAPPEFRLRSDR